MIPILLAAALVVGVAPVDIDGAGPAHVRRISQLYADEIRACGEAVSLAGLNPAFDAELARCYGKVACIGTLARTFAKADLLLVGSASRLADTYAVELRLVDLASNAPIGRLRQTLPGRLDVLVSAVKASGPDLCRLIMKPRDGEELELTLPSVPFAALPPEEPDLTLTLPPPEPPPAATPKVEPAARPPVQAAVALNIDPASSIVDATTPSIETTPKPVPAPVPTRAPPKPRVDPKPLAVAPPPPPAPPPVLAPPVTVPPEPAAPVRPGLWLGIGAGVAGLAAIGCGIAATSLRSGDAGVVVGGETVHRLSRADAEASNEWAFTANVTGILALALGAGAGWFLVVPGETGQGER